MDDDRTQLTISFRPSNLGEMVGQDHLTAVIQNHMASERHPQAWMFAGGTGMGKTTIARIIALSLQCSHQEVFGYPCETCCQSAALFDILEINASDKGTGKDDIGDLVMGAGYNPRPPSLYRVYILDEAQWLSTGAQNLLLKYFEDSPPSTVWIICTTEPRKILATLRGRCLTYTIPPLSVDGVEQLVHAVLEHEGVVDCDPMPLVEALLEHQVFNPRGVVMATDKFLAGNDPEACAMVGIESSVDTLKICRAICKGDWNVVREAYYGSTPDDARAIKGSVAGYLAAIMLKDGKASKCVTLAKCIDILRLVDDAVITPSLAAALFRICQEMKQNPL